MNRFDKLMISCLALAAIALSGISTVRPAFAAEEEAPPGNVQCGTGVQNKCGQKCTERTWYGACDVWEDIYNRTGN
ncbi:MAG: hypothetical protein IPP98_05535 [Gemmatimonadetes bacterium]|nr:hypothetical protein [Gemmatimonadota bacterium]